MTFYWVVNNFIKKWNKMKNYNKNSIKLLKDFNP